MIHSFKVRGRVISMTTINNARIAGAGSWRKGTIYFHTKSSGIWVAPRHQKKLEGHSPAAIAAKAIRLLNKGKFGYLGAVDKVAVDDAPTSRKRIHRLFLYNIKNSKPHRYDFRRAYANAIHRVLSSPSGLIHPNGRELLPASKLHAKQFRQLRATEKVALKAFFSRVSKSKSKSKSPKGVSHHVPGLSGPGSTAVPAASKPKSKSPKGVSHHVPGLSGPGSTAVPAASKSKSKSKSTSRSKSRQCDDLWDITDISERVGDLLGKGMSKEQIIKTVTAQLEKRYPECVKEDEDFEPHVRQWMEYDYEDYRREHEDEDLPSPGAAIKALPRLKPRSTSDEYRIAVRPVSKSKSKSKSKSPPKQVSPGKVAAAAAAAAENAAAIVISAAAPGILSARNQAAAAAAAEEAAAIVIDAAAPGILSARKQAAAAASAEKAAAIVIAAASPHKTPSPHKPGKSAKKKSVTVSFKRPRRKVAEAFAAHKRSRKVYPK
jgi:hypothetical protein